MGLADLGTWAARNTGDIVAVLSGLYLLAAATEVWVKLRKSRA